MFIDTHCHLNFKAFNKILDGVIDEAKIYKVEKIIVPGTNLKTNRKSLEIINNYDFIYSGIGIHPVHVSRIDSDWKKRLIQLVKNKKVVAIGECGLDYYRNNNVSYIKEKQKEIFEEQVKLAIELKLPLIIHNRNASEDVLKIISKYKKNYRDLKGAFHCFQGNNKLLNWALNHDFYIGITGLVSFDQKMKNIVKMTPLKKLLLETDSPYLVPEPLRTQKIFPNRPKNVKIVAEWIAKINGDSFLEICEQTTKNAHSLFGLKK